MKDHSINSLPVDNSLLRDDWVKILEKSVTSVFQVSTVSSLKTRLKTESSTVNVLWYTSFSNDRKFEVMYCPVRSLLLVRVYKNSWRFRKFFTYLGTKITFKPSKDPWTETWVRFQGNYKYIMEYYIFSPSLENLESFYKWPNLVLFHWLLR